jgi:hypothetical protein
MLLMALTFLTLRPPPALALKILIADDYYDGLDSDLYLLSEFLPEHQVYHLPNIDFDSQQVLLTNDPGTLSQFDAVLFYASGDDGLGRPITQEEHDALEQYIQQGGHLICTGYDILADSEDALLADLVRSTVAGDEPRVNGWKVSALDHYFINGPFGDFRGKILTVSSGDHDKLKADAKRGAISLGALIDSDSDKLIFTWLGAGKGSVGVWNGNDGADDWIASEYPDGASALAILKNWLAGLIDADHDGYPAFADSCPWDPNKTKPGQSGCGQPDGGGPVTPSCSAADCSCLLDSDGDGVADCADRCPNDPQKSEPGACGCGLRDSDQNGNGVPDCQLQAEAAFELLSVIKRIRKLAPPEERMLTQLLSPKRDAHDLESWLRPPVERAQAMLSDGKRRSQLPRLMRVAQAMFEAEERLKFRSFKFKLVNSLERLVRRLMQASRSNSK